MFVECTIFFGSKFIGFEVPGINYYSDISGGQSDLEVSPSIRIRVLNFLSKTTPVYLNSIDRRIYYVSK